MADVLVDKNWKCKICGHETETEEGMKQHVKRVHKENLEADIENKDRHLRNWVLTGIWWIISVLAWNLYTLFFAILFTIGAIYLDRYYKKSAGANRKARSA